MISPNIIQKFIDTETGTTPFSDANITCTNTSDQIQITVGYACQLEIPRLQQALAAFLRHELKKIIPPDDICITQTIVTHKVQAGLKPLTEVKNIIAIASGKGGVGKSSVSVNLAVALAQQGAAVGLLDADIYGPSQARMLGGAVRPQSLDGKTMEPIMRHGLQTLSMADLVDEETAMIWRGPMVTQTLIQLLRECHWQALDYLIIDLPPGTGDTQLTLAQQVPVSGVIIVTTPQDIALLDARKAKAMFDKVSIPILGLVENMSAYHCPNCGDIAYIFGRDGGKQLTEQYQVSLLGQVPLDIRLRESADTGVPITLSTSDTVLVRCYQHIAMRVSMTLAQKQKSYTQAFPNIVVERTMSMH